MAQRARSATTQQNLDNIRISSLHHAHYHVMWAEQVISILDPAPVHTFVHRGRTRLTSWREVQPPTVPRGTRHIVRRFEDCDEGPLAPTRSDIDDLLSFVKVGRRTLVHCHAGMSRSVSVAMGVMLLHGMSYDEIGIAIRHYEVSDALWVEPNMLIAAHVDDILGHDGAFTNYVWDHFFAPYTRSPMPRIGI